MKGLIVAAAFPVVAAAGAAAGGLSWDKVLASAIGTSPIAGLALYLWQGERKERREWTKEFVALAKNQATTNEKIADRLDRIEKGKAP